MLSMKKGLKGREQENRVEWKKGKGGRDCEMREMIKHSFFFFKGGEHKKCIYKWRVDRCVTE